MARSDKLTAQRNKIERYSDFVTDFDFSPITGYLAKVTNEQAVRQSLKNLILTNVGERFYNSRLGSRLQASLFEPVSPETVEVIRLLIKEVVDGYEPRAIIHDIKASESVDSNAYDITIVFSVINIPEQNFVLQLSVLKAR